MTLHVQFAILAIAAALCGSAKAQEEAPVAAWVEQTARTSEHVFLVQLVRYDDLYAPKAIKVIDRKSGALVQEIADANGLEMDRDPARFIRLLDANADGHPDIALAVNNGGSGPNSMDNVFLFDRKTGRYALHAGLSELPQLQVDSKGIISSASRGGCCQSVSETYRLIGGKLTRLSSREEALSMDGKSLRLTTGTLRGGKMYYKKQRVALPPGY